MQLVAGERVYREKEQLDAYIRRLPGRFPPQMRIYLPLHSSILPFYTSFLLIFAFLIPILPFSSARFSPFSPLISFLTFLLLLLILFSFLWELCLFLYWQQLIMFGHLNPQNSLQLFSARARPQCLAFGCTVQLLSVIGWVIDNLKRTS